MHLYTQLSPFVKSEIFTMSFFKLYVQFYTIIFSGVGTNFYIVWPNYFLLSESAVLQTLQRVYTNFDFLFS